MKTHRKWKQCLTGLTCLILLLISNAVYAQQERRNGPPPEDFIEHFDADGDGKVSKEEFPGPDDHFTHLDQNGDGFIGEDEKPTGPPPRRQSSGEGTRGDNPQGRTPGQNPMNRFDANGDGKLSIEEFPGPDAHFNQFDTNRDGYLDPDELPKGPPPPRKRDDGTNGPVSDETIPTVPGEGVPYAVVDTGQRTCYDNAIRQMGAFDGSPRCVDSC